MNRKSMTLVVATSLALSTMLSSCTTENAYTGEKQTSNATKGALIGAVGGAFLGALTGNSKNALIGAAVGATAGGLIGHSQDKQEADLRAQLKGTGVQIQRDGDNIKLIMPGDITFATNQADLQQQFLPVLNSVGIVLQKYTDTYVRVAGFTDSTGSPAYNLQLSKQRAASVRNYLQQQGVAAARLVNVGYGEANPIASNQTAQGRALNRRVEISLVPIQR
jgi:outer membrane protein OmpA-like peptidoglycan-associated protein